jgi:(p)ppGpp synthase/HD superfamily hydrolase
MTKTVIHSSLDMVVKSKYFATAAHEAIKQKRKYTGEPYIVHPAEVVQILIEHFGSQENSLLLQAAWLHDVLEDTGVTLPIIVSHFGNDVALIVDELTEKAKLSDGNRAKRKAMECARLATVSMEAQNVKLADLISNTKSIIAEDPAFAVTYLREKASLIKVLTNTNQRLYQRAEWSLSDAVRKLPKKDTLSPELIEYS